jgi:hypothetical protein
MVFLYVGFRKWIDKMKTRLELIAKEKIFLIPDECVENKSRALPRFHGSCFDSDGVLPIHDNKFAPAIALETASKTLINLVIYVRWDLLHFLISHNLGSGRTYCGTDLQFLEIPPIQSVCTDLNGVENSEVLDRQCIKVTCRKMLRGI